MHIDCLIVYNVNFMNIDETVHDILYSNKNKMQYKLNHDPFVFP